MRPETLNPLFAETESLEGVGPNGAAEAFALYEATRKPRASSACRCTPQPRT